MAQSRQYYYPSTDEIHQIHAVRWLPEGDTKPRAILQISHGILEHVGRYDAFAAWLADKGFVVMTADHLGHGQSFENPEDYGFFAESGGWDLALKDMHRLYELAHLAYPNLPYFLLGHSMGSFLARSYLIQYPGELTGCILSGTGEQPDFVCAVGLLISKLERLRLGPHGRSKLANNLCFGGYNRHTARRTDCDWLSRDDTRVDDYVADPLCGGVPAISLIIDMLGGIRFNHKKANLAKMDKSTPVFFISGEDDPVGGYGKGVHKAVDAFRKTGCTDIALKLYPGGRHEMLNETNRLEVYADILRWLGSHIPPEKNLFGHEKSLSPEELFASILAQAPEEPPEEAEAPAEEAPAEPEPETPAEPEDPEAEQAPEEPEPPEEEAPAEEPAEPEDPEAAEDSEKPEPAE